MADCSIQFVSYHQRISSLIRQFVLETNLNFKDMLSISDLPNFSAGTKLAMTMSIGIFVGLVAVVLLALCVATVYNAIRGRRRLKMEEAEEGKTKGEKEWDVEVRTLRLVRHECVC